MFTNLHHDDYFDASIRYRVSGKVVFVFPLDPYFFQDRSSHCLQLPFFYITGHASIYQAEIHFTQFFRILTFIECRFLMDDMQFYTIPIVSRLIVAIFSNHQNLFLLSRLNHSGDNLVLLQNLEHLYVLELIIKRNVKYRCRSMTN